jgi:hypothetical protein
MCLLRLLSISALLQEHHPVFLIYVYDVATQLAMHFNTHLCIVKITMSDIYIVSLLSYFNKCLFISNCPLFGRHLINQKF